MVSVPANASAVKRTTVNALVQAAEELGEEVIVGLYRSHDAFYRESKAAGEGLEDRMRKWEETGVAVVENESGMKTLTLLTKPFQLAR